MRPRRRARLLAILAAVLLPLSGASPASQQKVTTAPASTSAGSGKALGSPQAPITVEVFSDFQCPGCRDLYQQTLRPLIDNYVASGKVYLVHRDFPWSFHKYSRDAARYANAAAKIGRFEKVVEALYARQGVWSNDGSLEATVAAALTPAEMKRVRDLVKGGKLDTDIDRDVQLANKVPVRSTPTVLVMHKGQTYPLPSSGVTYSLLRQFLDDLLRR